MPSKYQNLIIHWFHIFILIFNHVDTIFNCIKIDILDRHFHSKIHFLLVYILHTRFLHNTFLLYAITRYFGIIHFFQASSIKPDQSWVQSVKNIKLIISPAAVTFHTSCVWYIEHRWTTQKHTFIAGPQPASWRSTTPSSATIPEPSWSPFLPGWCSPVLLWRATCLRTPNLGVPPTRQPAKSYKAWWERAWVPTHPSLLSICTMRLKLCQAWQKPPLLYKLTLI